MEPLRQIEPEQFPLPDITRDDAATVARRAVPVAPGAAGADVAGDDGSASDASGASGFVTAMYGAQTLSVPVAGLTVAAAYAELRELMHLPETVFALVDGRVASADERITTGTTLEFIRKVGEKGGRASCRR